MKRQSVFSARVMIALTLVGVFSFSALLTLSSFAPEWTTGNDGRSHALSRAATGYAGIVRLARQAGRAAVVSRTSGTQAPFAILTPEGPISAQEINARVTRGALIVLPKWLSAPDQRHPGWIAIAGEFPLDALAMHLAEIAPKAHVARSTAKGRQTLRFVDEGVALHDGGSLETGVIDKLQTLEGEGISPIVMTSDGRTVLARIRPPQKLADGAEAVRPDLDIYVLSDPDLINTMGVADIDTARTGLAILDAVSGEPLVFDVTINGFEGARSLMRMALSPPFLAATLCLVAAAFLIGWRAAVRASPPEREGRAIALGKRALADNAAALIRNAKREPRMGWPYAQIAANKAAERLAPARRRNEELVAFLDRMGAARNTTGRFSDLAADASASETRAGLLTAAQKLYDWMKEMLRASG